MQSVLTLVAPEGKQKINETLITQLSEKITGSGGEVVATDWLKPSYACDLLFKHLEHEQAEKIATELIAEAAIDFIVQPAINRRKKMLISDMDSTMITVECIDEIADFAGVKARVADITERAMRGELDFMAALSERVALLKGLNATILQQVYAERVRFMPGARTLVQTMRRFGAHTILVSGGFDFFTARVAAGLGFHAHRANTLEIINGHLSGTVNPPVLDKHAKHEILLASVAEHSLVTDDVLAVGDGANDLPMLLAAGLGVAYHAKPVVQQSARARINHADLSALLYMQGYREANFINMDG